MISQRLKDFLAREGARYEVITHPEEFTAQETAAVEHISGRIVAKVVLVKAGEKHVMVVVPANRMVDLLKVASALEMDDVRVESEKEFKELFPDSEVGAMPPLGRLYNLSCFVDESIFEGREISFNAGTHRESIRMLADDYRRIVEATIGDFATPARALV